MNFKNRHNTKAFRENPLICNVQNSSMKSRFPIFFCLFLFALGCSKDKFEVNPSLRIKSYTATVGPGQTFTAVLEYSQKNGKIDGDTLIGIRHRYNPTSNANPDTFYTILTSADSQIPDANSAEFNLTLDYDLYLHTNGGSENDTIDLKFALIDLSGRSSDTVKTGKIVILQ
jgi:hypothetical protein